MPSIRSAAELKAPTTASDAALARSACDEPSASCKAAIILPRDARTFCIASAEFVGQHQRSHHCQSRVADFAELARADR